MIVPAINSLIWQTMDPVLASNPLLMSGVRNAYSWQLLSFGLSTSTGNEVFRLGVLKPRILKIEGYKLNDLNNKSSPFGW